MSYVLQWMFEKNEKKKVRNKFTQQQWWWEIIKCSCVNANHSTNYWHKQCVWRGEIFNRRRCRANQTNGMILLFINLLSSTLLFFCMNISLFISGRFYFFAHAQVECSNDFFSVDFSLEWTVCLCVTVYLQPGGPLQTNRSTTATTSKPLKTIFLFIIIACLLWTERFV